MYPQPRGGAARRLRWSTLTALSLVAGLGAGPAWADIQVHVMNCTSQTIQAQAYDSKDSVKLLPASSTSFPHSGDSGSLHCAGEGKGYCQMSLSVLNPPAECNTKAVDFHLDSGKWAVVTNFVKQKNSNGDTTCSLVVEQNLDSAPTSCNYRDRGSAARPSYSGRVASRRSAKLSGVLPSPFRGGGKGNRHPRPSKSL